MIVGRRWLGLSVSGRTVWRSIDRPGLISRLGQVLTVDGDAGTGSGAQASSFSQHSRSVPL